MRCSKKLIEDRGICADCEILFLDDAVRLKQALEVALRDERIMFANLTSVQERCSVLLEENRSIRAQFNAVRRETVESCAKAASEMPLCSVRCAQRVAEYMREVMAADGA